MRNKEKKLEFFDMMKELAELQSKTPDETLANQLERIIKGLLRETMSLESAIRFVDNRIKSAKRTESIAFWATITKVIKKYFELIS